MRYPIYDGEKPLRAERAYEDQQRTMWVQFATGLYRISGAIPQRLVRASVREIYSDRDGNLWAGPNGEGLLRFKDRSVRMYTTKDGLPRNIPMTVLSRRDGSLWVGNNCGGLSVLDKHRFRTYAEKDGLSNSCVWALAEDESRNLWVGTWGEGTVPLCKWPLHSIFEATRPAWRHRARDSSRKRRLIVDCG